MIISVNGKFVDHIELTGDEPEFDYGFGVFETIRTYNGKLFHLTQHLKRLQQSAEIMNFELPHAIEKIEGWANAHTKSNSDLRLKIIAAPKNIYILSRPLRIKNSIYQNGISMKLYQLERFMPAVKKLNYWQEIQANAIAKKAKCYDALLINSKQEITEGAFSNIFYIKNDVVITPRNNILQGITRNIVLQLARQHYQVKEKKVLLDELLLADECFLTQTTTGIVPVVKIDKRTIRNGKPGLITADLISKFETYTQNI
ncbi:MAG: aminotransferase class IV [bacterium]|nr:aminotransferase class IV [bacterium]